MNQVKFWSSTNFTWSILEYLDPYEIIHRKLILDSCSTLFQYFALFSSNYCRTAQGLRWMRSSTWNSLSGKCCLSYFLCKCVFNTETFDKVFKGQSGKKAFLPLLKKYPWKITVKVRILTTFQVCRVRPYKNGFRHRGFHRTPA